MAFYYEGFDAAHNGVSCWNCPYKPGTAGYKYWINGWDAALLQSLTYGV